MNSAADVAPLECAERASSNKGGQSLHVILILSLLMGFASISTDLYLPALPTMAHALRSNQGAMEMTISGYLIGFSVGQLFWGPVSDRYGRRLPIAIGLVLFVIGSAGCALSHGASEMIGWRLVQAVGASAGVVLSRAMVRDLYSGARSAQMLSTLITVMAVAPLLGPIVGGQILHFASWQMIFWTLVGIGVATFAALFTLPETLPPERRNQQGIGGALASYVELLREPRLLALAGAGAFYYVGVFAYVAGTPFAYIDFYHLPPQFYGLVFGTGILGIMGSNLINARLVMKRGLIPLLRFGSVGVAVAGIAAAITASTGFGGLAGLAFTLFLYIAMTGFIVANSLAGSMSAFPDRAGAVSALVGALQYGAGMVGSGLVGTFADGTPRPLGWLVALAGLGVAACVWFCLPAEGRSLRSATR